MLLTYWTQGFHASWKVLDFFLKIPGPEKSWKISLKVVHVSCGSNGKQASTVCTQFLSTIGLLEYTVEC